MNSLNKLIITKNLFVIFLSFFLLGFLFSIIFLYESPSVYKDSLKVNSFIEIFLNNLIVNLVIIVSGIFTLGILSTFIVFINGQYFGSFFITNFFELDIIHFLTLILFHGPIEILGLSFGYILSVLIPWSIISGIWRHNLLLKPSVIKMYIRYFLYSIIFLLIASLVEYSVILINYLY